MDDILMLNTTIDETTQYDILVGLLPVLRAHAAFLGTKFPDGQAYVDGVLATSDDLLARMQRAIKEASEAEQATAAWKRALALMREHVIEAKRHARRVIKHTARTDPRLADSVAGAYGMRGNRLSVTRNPSLVRLLGFVAEGHAQHGELMQRWGVSAQFMAHGVELNERWPALDLARRRETSEAEEAVIARDALEAEAIAGINSLLETLALFAAENPQAFQQASSILNKYRARLRPPSAAPASAEDPDDADDLGAFEDLDALDPTPEADAPPTSTPST